LLYANINNINNIFIVVNLLIISKMIFKIYSKAIDGERVVIFDKYSDVIESKIFSVTKIKEIK